MAASASGSDVERSERTKKLLLLLRRSRSERNGVTPDALHRSGSGRRSEAARPPRRSVGEGHEGDELIAPGTDAIKPLAHVDF
jgi:hypothetical protein